MGSLGALLCKPHTGLSGLIETFQTAGRAHMACVPARVCELALGPFHARMWFVHEACVCRQGWCLLQGGDGRYAGLDQWSYAEGKVEHSRCTACRTSPDTFLA